MRVPDYVGRVRGVDRRGMVKQCDVNVNLLKLHFIKIYLPYFPV